ncbi:hypothetical protein RFI_34327, partial [Reticulomyxa filosa]
MNNITEEITKLVYKYSMKDKTWNQCKITLPIEIYASFAILSDDDTNVHVVGGLNAKYEEQKMHVSVDVEKLFEKSELLKMPKTYGRMIELKKEIARLMEIAIRAKRKTELLKKVTARIKLERPYMIPVEKERNSGEVETREKSFDIPQEWKSRKVAIEALNKQLKAWEEEKRTELNEMNWNEIWSSDGTFEQVRSNDINRLTSISSIIKTLLGYRTSIKTDINTTTKEFDELIEKQNSIKQKIDEKY